jgi:hypothetical protein
VIFDLGFVSIVVSGLGLWGLNNHPNSCPLVYCLIEIDAGLVGID